MKPWLFNKKLGRAAGAILLTVWIIPQAQAAVTQVPPFTGTHTETWEEFPNYQSGGAYSSLPILGGLATISDSSSVIYIYEPSGGAGWGLCAFSAQVSDGTKGMGLNTAPDTATIVFNTPVTDFGAYWGAAVGCGSSTISFVFLDADGNQLGTDAFDYVSPDSNGALEWRGYHFTVPIKSLTYTGDIVVNDGMQATVASCAPAPANMIAWWRADGNADDSVGGHHGSLMAGATFGTGEVNQAFSLDGNGAHVAVGDVDLPATFTIDAWINPTDLSSNPRIFSKDDDTSVRGYELRATASGYLEATVTNGANGLTFYRTDTAPLVSGSFQHVAVTYDGSAADNEKFKFYVNGANIPASPVIGSDAGGTPKNNSVAAVIGIASNRQTGPFNGLIDEVEVFDRVLGSAEIASIFNAGSAGKCECTPPPDNMISWWPAEGNATDIQGGHDGSLQGGVSFTAGEVGQAFSFNGVDGAVVVPNNTALEPAAITLDAWIFVDPTVDPNGTYGIAGKYFAVTGERGYELLIVNQKLTLQAGSTNQTSAISASDVPFGQWVHVAGTIDSTASHVYINGILAGSGVGVPSIESTNQDFVIGATGGPFKGMIDEVEVFGTALSQSDIQAIYHAGSAGKCRPCITAPAEMTDWWPGDGNANNIQGYHQGTLKNGASFAGGKVAAAFSFDGVNDYVEVGDLDLPGAFTIDAWINPNNLSNNPMIISSMDGSNGYYVLILSDGKLLALARHDTTEDTVYITAPVITTGSWQHVAVTYDGNAGPDGKFKFYVDGQSVAANTSSDAGGAPGPSTVPTTIAAYQGVSEFFKGLIDEVEIFGRVLLQSEIQTISNAGSGGKCKPAGLVDRQLINISSRVAVGTGDNVGIGGFVLHTDPPSGTVTLRQPRGGAVVAKPVLIRGLGPSLQVAGNPVPGRLMDPVLDLYDSNGTLIDHNDNWMEEPDGVANPARTATIQATGLAPSDPMEAAILRNLATDNGYTAILSGKDDSTGIGLVEIYDMQPTTDTHLINISTRAFVSTGDDVLIGGFVVEGGTSTRVLLRALGQSLPPSVPNRLEDPVLELYDNNGALLERNDDWGSSPEAADIGTILPPGDPKDSAILFTPAPGGYTAIVTGNNPNPTGNALVEVYRVANP